MVWLGHGKARNGYGMRCAYSWPGPSRAGASASTGQAGKRLALVPRVVVLAVALTCMRACLPTKTWGDACAQAIHCAVQRGGAAADRRPDHLPAPPHPDRPG